MYLVAGSFELQSKPWRQPFKRNYLNKSDAYQLNFDAPASLTSTERAMCRRYAIEILEWDEQDRRYLV